MNGECFQVSTYKYMLLGEGEDNIFNSYLSELA